MALWSPWKGLGFVRALELLLAEPQCDRQEDHKQTYQHDYGYSVAAQRPFLHLYGFALILKRISVVLHMQLLQVSDFS